MKSLYKSIMCLFLAYMPLYSLQESELAYINLKAAETVNAMSIGDNHYNLIMDYLQVAAQSAALEACVLEKQNQCMRILMEREVDKKNMPVRLKVLAAFEQLKIKNIEIAESLQAIQEVLENNNSYAYFLDALQQSIANVLTHMLTERAMVIDQQLEQGGNVLLQGDVTLIGKVCKNLAQDHNALLKVTMAGKFSRQIQERFSELLDAQDALNVVILLTLKVTEQYFKACYACLQKRIAA